MDDSWLPTWLSEWESDDCSFLEQGEMNHIDSELFPIEESLHELIGDHHEIEISEAHSPEDERQFKRPAKRQTRTLNSPILDNIVSNQRQAPSSSSSSAYMVSFQNQLEYSPQSFGFQDPTLTPVFFESTAQLPKVKQVYSSSNTKDCELGNKTDHLARPESSRRRTTIRGKDHIILERKRRERITLMLIQLSALVPGLKKLDQRSVLFHAIQYVKQLQERVKLLDEKTKTITIESVVLRQKPNTCADKAALDSTSCITYFENSDPLDNEKTLPEVEARVSARDVLIRIQCKRLKGQVANILMEIENQHLLVINSIVLPFGTALLEIIIIAQMEDEFCTTVKELAFSLRRVLLP